MILKFYKWLMGWSDTSAWAWRKQAKIMTVVDLKNRRTSRM